MQAAKSCNYAAGRRKSSTANSIYLCIVSHFMVSQDAALHSRYHWLRGLLLVTMYTS
jgi:hypothetical protein